MTERNRLEKLAIAAHRRGDTWAQFWPTVADAVAQAEPWDLAARSKLVTRLSLLVTAGDLHGSRPIGDWWLDDRASATEPPSPHDSETAARVNWQRAGVQQVHSFGGQQ